MPARTGPGPRRRPPVSDNPFAKRLGLIVLAFLVLLPVAKLLDREDPEQTIATVTDSPGDTASTSAAPATTPATTVPLTATPIPPPTAPPTTAAPPPPAPVQSVAPATAAPKPQATAPAAKKKAPATTAAKKAPVTAAPKPAPTTAAPKPPPTPAPTPPPTAAPAPTPPPAPAVAKTYTAAEVEAIIREVWPDDLEDQAVAIAYRESKLIPTVRNYCCYGVFAIYYEAGKRFLNSIGVTSAEQLFDPWVNIRAAFALYGIAGWQPWAL